jgi:hypothetical protein
LEPIGVEAVTDVADGLDHVGLAGVGFEFFAEGEYVGVYGAGVVDAVGPGSIEDVESTEGSACGSDEDVEEAEFLGGEFDVGVAESDAPLDEVDFEVAVVEEGGGHGGAESPGEGFDSREEFLHSEGFGEVVVGSGFESVDDVGFGVAGGEDQDHGFGLVADPPTKFQSIPVG